VAVHHRACVLQTTLSETLIQSLRSRIDFSISLVIILDLRRKKAGSDVKVALSDSFDIFLKFLIQLRETGLTEDESGSV